MKIDLCNMPSNNSSSIIHTLSTDILPILSTYLAKILGY